MKYFLFVSTITLLLGSLGWSSAATKDPAVSLLVVNDTGIIDARYAQELTQAGYRVETVAFTRQLSADYLKQFGVIILSRLPYAGEQYSVDSVSTAELRANLPLLHDYIAAGGGLVLEPAMSEFGEAYTEIYNDFLQRYDAQFIPEQLRQDSETKGAYAAGIINGNHPITAGLKQVLYPINVLRWDHAYSTTPAITGKEWKVLAAGKPGSGTHQALDNERVGEQLTTNRTIFAIRQAGKGYLAISAIHSYYTLTHAYSTEKNLGENNTGMIDGIVLHGEKAGRPSEMAALLDRTYRFLAVNSVKNGLGTGTVALPKPAAAPAYEPVIDWHTMTPPTTWQHRVKWMTHDGADYYDEMPDPLVSGEVQYFKALVGPRTACSSGSGTVLAYREAAIKAGYSAIMFAETLADTNKTKWDAFVRECAANSDDKFVCVPGLDLEDFQGGRYLVLGAKRFPDPSWLTPDEKKLLAVRMLSLGWFGNVSSVHRSGRMQLHPKMYKFYQGITVATYDSKGRQVDDGLATYQWAVASDSNPIPIAAHEVSSPDDVALAAQAGYQQILPAPSLLQAVDYFRFGMPHYFECPLRYFISEGPLLNGWSIRNKDIGNPLQGRDHWRLGIGVAGTDPLAEVTLYDGQDVAGRWMPNDAHFTTTVDGFHDMQHEFMLLARDSKNRRVLSPGIRTVTTNWRLRCGDRQNWLGTMNIYTGWFLHIGGFTIPFRNTSEGSTYWLGDGGGNPCPIFDYPLFANHVRVEDVDLSTKYVDADWEKIGGDAKPTYAVRPTDFTDAGIRITNYVEKTYGFAVARVDLTIRLKRDVEPDPRAGVYPVLASAYDNNDLLLIPGQAQAKLSEQKGPVDLPVGSYAGGIIPLTPGLQIANRQIGFPAPSHDTLTLYAGTTYTASYLILKGSPFQWRVMDNGFDHLDAIAEQAQQQMGFAGTPPYAFALTQGTLDKLAYNADFTAQNGGVAGTLTNAQGKALLYNLPLQIHGLNQRCASAVWRSDAPRLDYFANFQGTGMVTFNGDKTVDFYAGNVATCDPALFVSAVVWNAQEAWFRVNNPTTHDITTTFATPTAIKGYKAVNKQITVKAGSSVEVKE